MLVIAYLLNVSVMVCGSDSQLWYYKHYTCKRRSQVPHEITVFCKTINRERGRRGKRLPPIWHCNWTANEVSRDLEGEEEFKVATLHSLWRSHLGTAASPGDFVRVNFISRSGSDTPWWQAAVCGWWWWLMELTAHEIVLGVEITCSVGLPHCRSLMERQRCPQSAFWRGDEWLCGSIAVYFTG